MTPRESLEIRKQMAEMHDSVKERIERAYENKQYIEVCWLCYACFESRVNRIFLKICSGCSKPNRDDNRHIGIITKLECCIRLIKSNYPPLSKENIDLIRKVKGWCKERNGLIHGMISLEYYNDADKKFAALAKNGKNLVREMYSVGTDVREYYYKVDKIPAFDETVITKCDLEKKCIKEK